MSLIAATGKTAPLVRQMRRDIALGLATIAVFVGAFGGWAGYAPLASAVVAGGSIAIVGNSKVVQHSEGGQISAIYVKNGQRVEAGEPLVQLDSTNSVAGLAIVRSRLDQLLALATRLRAERDGATELRFPAELLDRQGEPDVDALMASEQQAFALRSSTRRGLADRFETQKRQAEAAIQGYAGQLEAREQELALLAEERDNLRVLFDKGLVQLGRLSELERAYAQATGTIGSLNSSIAQSRQQIAELDQQIAGVQEQAAADASTQLRETETSIFEYRERYLANKDMLDKLTIRAPVTGVVAQMSVFTVGGVVGPREQIMTVVPEAGELDIEARIAAQDIDMVTIGNPVRIHLAGMSATTVPELHGTVTLVPSDIVRDDRLGVEYYPVRLRLDAGESERLGGRELMPGMPVSVFIAGETRTFLQYLWKPVGERLSRAMLEE